MGVPVQVFLAPLSVGDVKPVSVVVNPSDRATIVSGTWALFIAQSGDPLPVPGPSPANGNLIISNANDGSYIVTDNPIDWPIPGEFVMRFALIWSDGQEDNTLSAKIQVNPPAT